MTEEPEDQRTLGQRQSQLTIKRSIQNAADKADDPDDAIDERLAKKELADFEKARRDMELANLREHNEGRQTVSKFIFNRYLSGWSIFTVAMVIWDGTGRAHFAPAVVVTLLGTTLGQIIGLAIIVTKHFFPDSAKK